MAREHAKKDCTVCFRTTGKQVKAIDKIAAREGRSRSQVIFNLLEKVLARQQVNTPEVGRR